MILAIILLSYVMIVLDVSIVITGLPKIQAELGFTDAGLSWVSNAYTLAFGGCLLIGARAGDIFGRRRMFVTGLTIFVIASLLIGAAQTPLWLIAARAVQGFGSAILAPSTLALLQTNFPAGPERTRAISYYASAAGVSASVGLVLGGVLADWLSWRVGFFINGPIGVGLVLVALRAVRETRPQSGAFDLIGAVTSTLGMSALVLGIVNSAADGWSSTRTLQALAASGALLAIFVLTERVVKQPIMPLRLFASRERSAAYAARMLFIGANVGFFFFSTQLMQGVLGYSPAMAGLAFLPATITNFLVALGAPRLIAQIGSRNVLVGSMLFGLIGIAWLSGASAGGDYWVDLGLPMLLIGIGQGGALGPLTLSGVADVPAADAGAASGLVNTAHQIGGSLGLGLQVAAAAIGAGAFTGRELLAHRVGNAMGCAVLLVVLALLVVLVAVPRAKPAEVVPTGVPRQSPEGSMERPLARERVQEER
ncbi:MFS transporter [Azospirillum oryzae]|uniref:MFS transporter n=1 Tax=Azospirillum oryzae TaxID=286727 RepID=UPI001FCD70C5|nr:MFS transporter [Azospirillum oryzae]